MLQLIGYDLQRPVKDYQALREGVAKAGGGINLLNGPWICGADRPSGEVLKIVEDKLKQAGSLNDKLLVFPVRMGEIGTGRNLDSADIRYRPGQKTFAVAYTLRNPPGDHHVSATEQRKHLQAMNDAIESLGPTKHPLGALWFVKTKKSAHDVHLAIEKAVPLTPKDELLVAEVDTAARLNGRTVKGSCTKNVRVADGDWLTEADVLEESKPEALT